MTLTISAIYENGVLKPSQPLPFRERETVSVTVQTPSNWVDETYGILGWKGDSDELHRLALSPDFDIEDTP